jgi:hypothetical protein
MFESSPKWLPANLHDKENIMARSHAFAHEAFRVDAKAETSKSDTISLAMKQEAKDLYSHALKLQSEYKSGRSSFENAKPKLMNIIIGIVIAAEIISLPMLAINIYQMMKTKKATTTDPSLL